MYHIDHIVNQAQEQNQPIVSYSGPYKMEGPNRTAEEYESGVYTLLASFATTLQKHDDELAGTKKVVEFARHSDASFYKGIADTGNAISADINGMSEQDLAQYINHVRELLHTSRGLQGITKMALIEQFLSTGAEA